MKALKERWSKIGRNRYVQMLLATAVGWHQDRVSRLAAALSFYALLSLIPLLVTCHALFSLVVDRQMASFIGTDQAKAVRAMLDHAQAPSLASLQALIGSLVTFITAAGVFIELKDSMDAIWKVEKKKGKRGVKAFIRAYFAPLSMVLGFGFLLLMSLFLDALVSSAASALAAWHPSLLATLAIGNLVVGWLVAAVLFASIFRFLPEAKVSWRHVWLGAAITATMFIIGRSLIGIYLGTSDFTGRYGPAGAVVAVVVWIYYSAQILFIGAIFTREHARLTTPAAIAGGLQDRAATG
jgi:membrane protein